MARPSWAQRGKKAAAAFAIDVARILTRRQLLLGEDGCAEGWTLWTLTKRGCLPSLLQGEDGGWHRRSGRSHGAVRSQEVGHLLDPSWLPGVWGLVPPTHCLRSCLRSCLRHCLHAAPRLKNQCLIFILSWNVLNMCTRREQVAHLTTGPRHGFVIQDPRSLPLTHGHDVMITAMPGESVTGSAPLVTRYVLPFAWFETKVANPSSPTRGEPKTFAGRKGRVEPGGILGSKNLLWMPLTNNVGLESHPIYEAGMSHPSLLLNRGRWKLHVETLVFILIRLVRL